jgi:hypothetical protein
MKRRSRPSFDHEPTRPSTLSQQIARATSFHHETTRPSDVSAKLARAVELQLGNDREDLARLVLSIVF